MTHQTFLWVGTFLWDTTASTMSPHQPPCGVLHPLPTVFDGIYRFLFGSRYWKVHGTTSGYPHIMLYGPGSKVGFGYWKLSIYFHHGLYAIQYPSPTQLCRSSNHVAPLSPEILCPISGQGKQKIHPCITLIHDCDVLKDLSIPCLSRWKNTLKAPHIEFRIRVKFCTIQVQIDWQESWAWGRQKNPTHLFGWPCTKQDEVSHSQTLTVCFWVRSPFKIG